ncbi:GNAT family N-acetyltransferase [Brevibacillus daliensis]|uniref:GNAT family N-acetyltransferase n=1 Tax=Brevibacillus daliensis TaxID=2892995 RepID=UPI001E4DA4EE|nr:GNAT family N-acetyltransferase [Brevibacillus daliensis]
MKSTYQFNIVETEKELQDAMNVRRIVFVHEQQVPEELEIDEHDTLSCPTIHFVAYQGEHPVAASRLRPYEADIAKVERVAVLKETRGTGLGRELMLVMEEVAKKNSFHTLKLSAQLHAQAFYEKLGYVAYGEVFEDAGIDHVMMEKSL